MGQRERVQSHWKLWNVNNRVTENPIVSFKFTGKDVLPVEIVNFCATKVVNCV